MFQVQVLQIPMFQSFLHEFSGRSLGVLCGLLIGSAVTGWIARRRRRQDRERVLHGDARDTVVIHQHVVSDVKGPDGKLHKVLRIRTLGQSELRRVVPNAHLANDLLERARAVTPESTLISMDGPEGSYLLETLTNFVCDRVANRPLPHDVYIMTACCEPASLSHHQPITILLLREGDLNLFADWKSAREILVEHGSDGARILSLRDMAHRFREEQQKIAEMRARNERTAFAETMYILDLALDREVAPLPARPVPWDRFASVIRPELLKQQIPAA